MTDELKERVDKAAPALMAAGAKEVYVFGSASKGKIRPCGIACASKLPWNEGSAQRAERGQAPGDPAV